MALTATTVGRASVELGKATEGTRRRASAMAIRTSPEAEGERTGEGDVIGKSQVTFDVGDRQRHPSAPNVALCEG